MSATPVHLQRLKKLQEAMAERGIGALLLTNPVNVRYATGVSVMNIWTAINFARYALVPVSGEPVLFEYAKSLFLAKELWPQARPATAWQYRFARHETDTVAAAWAAEIGDLLKTWGTRDAPLGYDALDYYGAAALDKAGIRTTDADESIVAAKLIKTPDEIALLRQSCAVAEAALHELEAAIRPGISEQELLAVFWQRIIALGAEYSSTRLLTAGQRTNPWFHEAGTNLLRPGDLVGVDTDMTGPEGYLCDISRTFLCGDKADAESREAYRVAYDFIQGTIELCTPGRSYDELRRLAPAYPAAYEKQAYSCMLHGSGFDDEPPFVAFPHVRDAITPHGELKENMVLSIEFYAGKVGGRSGVKLEEQILITAKGPELMSRYPFASALLS